MLVWGAMKYVWLIVTVVALNGCNTLIGLGRDAKATFFWTNDKIHQMHNSGQKDPGAPVY